MLNEKTMDYKTIKFDEKEYYLVPKIKSPIDKDVEIIIETVNIETRKFIFVKTKGWWKNHEGEHQWANYYREEKENGDFEWYRTYGGQVTANAEHKFILEKWYQETLINNA